MIEGEHYCVRSFPGTYRCRCGIVAKNLAEMNAHLSEAVRGRPPIAPRYFGQDYAAVRDESLRMLAKPIPYVMIPPDEVRNCEEQSETT